MRKLIGSIIIIAAIVAAAGLYLGWFSVSSNEQPGETNVNLRIDKDKIKQDTRKAGEKAKEVGEKLEEKLRE